MGIRGERGSRHEEEFGVYAECLEWETVTMALDSFFREVIDGNVPLTNAEDWWQRQIIPDRVNRFNANWCLLFTAIAMFRERVGETIPKNVRADENLRWEALTRGGDWKPLVWEN